jgi:hypothetical protein
MTIRNMAAFKNWIKDVETTVVPEQVTKLQKLIVFDLFRRLVLKSPVGNPDLWAPQSLPPPPGYVGGRFRANWQISIAAPATGEIESTAEPGPPVLGEVPFGVTVWITNNVPYAERLETGWSRQAPQGIVSISLLEVQSGFV